MAAGWTCMGECGGGSWGRKSREREDKHPLEKKKRFEKKIEVKNGDKDED